MIYLTLDLHSIFLFDSLVKHIYREKNSLFNLRSTSYFNIAYLFPFLLQILDCQHWHVRDVDRHLLQHAETH